MKFPKVEQWFKDGFLYAVMLISGIVGFALVATKVATAYLGAS